MSKIEDFWNYINERHAIYLKRIDKQPSPWSDDLIFQQHKFTNVFRELDSTTIGLRRMLKQLWDEYVGFYDKPVATSPNDYRIGLKERYLRNQFITCILYRLFNWKGNAQFGPITNPTAWYYYLKGQLGNGQRIFGFNVNTNVNTVASTLDVPGLKLTEGERVEILDVYVNVCRDIVSDADSLIRHMKRLNTLYEAWGVLQEYNCVGPLAAYEFVCDLRYTDILRNATDIHTWCYISTDAVSGLIRLGLEPTLESIVKLFSLSANDLSSITNGVCGSHWAWEHKKIEHKYNSGPKYPYWELSEIEHCLRQFDKYERIKENG